jgi:tetratricopeptide (TPR) repeat protein
MSQPPPPLPPPNDGGSGGGGLGHSTPLVTIPSAAFAMPPPPLPPQQQQQPLTVAAVTDHPLSASMSGVDNRYSTPLSHSGTGGMVVSAATAATTGVPVASATTSSNTNAEATTAPLYISTTLTPQQPTAKKAVPKIVSAPMSPSQSLDSLADAFLEQGGTRSGTRLFAAPLPQTQTDLERVRILVERRAWGDVLSMTTNLLRGSSSHYTPIYAALLNYSPDQHAFPSLDSHQKEVVELIMLQCHAWLKMRRYNELAMEISRWSSFCHIHLVDENDKQTSLAPSWIPWSMHILAAASLQYTDNKNKDAATDALWKIRSAIMSTTTTTTTSSTDNATDGSSSNTSGSNSSTRPLDILCVEHALCNAFVRKKEWRMALECLERMIRQLPGAAKLEVANSITTTSNHNNNEDAADAGNYAKLLETAYQCECYSRQGRILLQVGALEQASKIFQKATLLWKQTVEATGRAGNSSRGSSIAAAAAAAPTLVANHPAIEQVPAQLQANDGLLAFAYNKYDAALESFRNAVNLMKLSSTNSGTSSMTVDGTYRMVRTYLYLC